MKKNSVLAVAAVLAVCVGVFFSGCDFFGNKKQVETIKIGAILPLTGSSAVIGEPKKRALDIAFEEYNGHNNINIKILFEDSQGTPKDGVSAFQKLLNDKTIRYYYIDLTTVVNSAIPLTNRNKVITFAGSAEPEITNQSDYLFRLFAGGDQEIQLMVDELKNENVDNIFVLHTDELYGINAYKFLEKEFTKRGGKILGHEEYPMNNTDFKAILLKAKSPNPQKIVLLGYGNEYAPLLKQAIELSINPSDLVCNLGGSGKSVIELPSNFTEGLTFIGPRFTYLMMNDQLKPEMEAFVNSYKNKYNELPDFRAAYTYDVIKILMSVWSEHKEDVNDMNKIRSYLTSIKDFKGASGNITFLSNGDTQTDLIIAKYQEGMVVLK